MRATLEKLRARLAASGPLALFALTALCALALALRLPALDAIPNPSGDEGNWTWIAFDLVAHRPTGLPPDARFVSLAFAHVIGLAYRVLGFDYAAARSVCVAGVIAGMLLSYAACARMGMRRAGLAVAALLAVHPWSVLWSRTVTVPYALSLSLATAGPLWVLCALRERSRRARALGLLLGAQLMFAGVHFSPLALCPIAFGALWVLARPRARRVLREPAPWVALALGALHTAPVLRGALDVAARGTTRPSHQFDRLHLRVFTYLRTVLDGFAGEATLRHFTGQTLSPVFEALAVLAALVLPVALVVAWRKARTRVSAGGGETVAPRAAGELRAFGVSYLAFALVALPCLLAPARPWNLPAIDAERYLFALLAPFALCAGALAQGAGPRLGAMMVPAFALYLLLGPTARAGEYFFRGGGADRGFWLLDGGGGYRGWKVARERVAAPWLIQREVERAAEGAPATILVPDYAFHPLHFANARTPYPTVDVTKFEPEEQPGRRYVIVLWSDGLFAPGFDQPEVVHGNDALRARMCTRFDGLRPLRAFTQPDGAPLFELWTGVLRAGTGAVSRAPGCERVERVAGLRAPAQVW